MALTVTEEQKKLLKQRHYRVVKTNFGWSPIKPNGNGILRGWSSTEEEAWWWCLQDSGLDETSHLPYSSGLSRPSR